MKQEIIIIKEAGDSTYVVVLLRAIAQEGYTPIIMGIFDKNRCAQRYGDISRDRRS